MKREMLREGWGALCLVALGFIIGSCASTSHQAPPPTMSTLAEPGAEAAETPDSDFSDESEGPLEITATPAPPPPGADDERIDEADVASEPEEAARRGQEDEEEDESPALEIVAEASSGPPPPSDEAGSGTTVAVAPPPAPSSAPERMPASEEEVAVESAPPPPSVDGAPDEAMESEGRRNRLRDRLRASRERRRREREARRRPAEPATPSAPPAPPSAAPAPAATPFSAPGGASTDGAFGRAVDTPVAPVRNVQQLPTSVLTAGTVPDVDRRAEYLSYLSRHPSERSQLNLDMSRRVRFRVVDGAGNPIHDAALTLIGSGARVEGRTHADGWWDFFPSVSAPQMAGSATLYIQTGAVNAQATVPVPGQSDGRDIVIRLPQAASVSPTVLDLAFLIDVTGSMGDELRYVNEEVVGIVSRVRQAVPQVQVRVGATFYRDRGDYIPVEQIPFSSDVQAFESHMRHVQATGGGDYPEDVNMGLAAALTTLQWSQGQAVRVLVVIADAPPQTYPDFPYTYHQAMSGASQRGIRFLPVAASGSDRTVEYLFRAMGAFTSTPYVYLTDDSGVGGHHMEADTDRVAIEMFSDLLTRMLISDLRGEGMHEAPGIDGAVMSPLQ